MQSEDAMKKRIRQTTTLALALAGTLFALYLGAVCVGDFLLKRKLAAEAREASATPAEDDDAAAPAGEDLHIL